MVGDVVGRTMRPLISSVVVFSVLCCAYSSPQEAAAATIASASGPHRRPWLTELFSEARRAFAADRRQPNAACRNDFRIYASHLANQTAWAVRMLESSDWPRMGLLAGINTHLGNWAECLKAYGAGITAQYCLVETKISYAFADNDDDDDDDDSPRRRLSSNFSIGPEDVSAWKLMQKFETNPIHISRMKSSWALCVPSSCTIEDIEDSLKRTLVPIFEKHGVSVAINLEPTLCERTANFVFPWNFYAVICSVTFVAIIVLATSSYYCFRTKKIRERKLCFWESFSLARNLERLNSSSLPSRYNIIYLVKVIGITLVMGGHIVLVETQSAMFQTEEMEKLFYPYQCFAALDACVDVFSVISGFLTFHFHFETAKRKGWPFVMFKLASQWVKLSAMVGLYIIYAVNVWPYIGDGPLWKQRILPEAELCRKYWWRNILAIANLFPPERMCLLHTWYLSVNLQLSALGALLLLAFIRSETFGIITSATAFLACTLWTALSVYSEGYNSIFLGYMKTLNNLAREKDFELYIATFTRVGPYILGFAAAFVTRKLIRKKYVFSKRRIFLILSLCTAMAVQCAYYRKNFNVAGRKYDVFENALYAALCRSILISPFSCFLCVYFTSWSHQKSDFNAFCQHKVWLSFGRLVPNVYFIHYILLLTVAMSRRTYSPIGNELDAFWHWAATFFYSFEYAFFLFLFVQSPISNVVKRIFAALIGNFKSNKNVDKRPRCRISCRNDDEGWKKKTW